MNDRALGARRGLAQTDHCPDDEAQQDENAEYQNAAIEPAQSVFQGLEIVVQECFPGLGGVTDCVTGDTTGDTTSGVAARASAELRGVSVTVALLRGDTITTLTRRLAARPLAVSLDSTG